MPGKDGVAVFSGPDLQGMGGVKAARQPGNDAGDNVFPHDKARVLRVWAKLPNFNALNFQLSSFVIHLFARAFRRFARSFWLANFRPLVRRVFLDTGGGVWLFFAAKISRFGAADCAKYARVRSSIFICFYSSCYPARRTPCLAAGFFMPHRAAG